MLERSGAFTTKSLYKELVCTGFSNRWMLCFWQTKVPLKIKIFLWRVVNDKIQSAEQLKKKNWHGPIECKMCGQMESSNHIVFRRALANFSWCIIRDVLGWPFSPSCPDDIFDFCRDSTNRQSKRVLYLFCGVAWSLWLICND